MSGEGRVTDSGVNVEQLMRQIQDEVRRDRRARLVARGGADEYGDPALFAIVERVLTRAVDERDQDVLILPELLGDELQWELQTHLRFASHRRALGRFVVWVKRRVLLPVMRWLYEYSLDNFRRQRRVNRVLFACIEELAIENARLRQDVERLTDTSR
jgi:hypothetical protein